MCPLSTGIWLFFHQKRERRRRQFLCVYTHIYTVYFETPLAFLDEAIIDQISSSGMCEVKNEREEEEEEGRRMKKENNNMKKTTDASIHNMF